MTNQFGQLLRQLRKHQVLTQEGLEQKSKVGVRTIRRLESGKANPNASTLRQLADALNLSSEQRTEFFALANGHEVGAPALSADADRQVPPEFQRPHLPTDLTRRAAELATEVLRRWRREWQHQQVNDPYPLPVRWTQVDGMVSDHPGNIHRSPAGISVRPTRLDGTFSEIADFYLRLPSRKLVVLGLAGSGKTALATQLVIDILGMGESSPPVPIPFAIGSWDPHGIRFDDWLTAQLTRDYPSVAAAYTWSLTVAAALVARGAILPVLDGFDELAKGLQSRALTELNLTDLPYVITSRPAEYKQAVSSTDVLTGAAVVSLEELAMSDVATYLPLATKPTGRPESATVTSTVWSPVVDQLRDDGDGEKTPLAEAFETPLMVYLARTMYGDTPGENPGVLADNAQFPDATAIKAHLIANYVPTVYKDGVRRMRSERDWNLPQVHRWLNYLARHTRASDSTGIAWWELGTSMRVSARSAIVALVTGAVVAIMGIAVGVALSAEVTSAEFTDYATSTAINLVVISIVPALLLGFAYVLVRRYRTITPEPSRISIRTTGPGGSLKARFAKARGRIAIALLGGAVLGSIIGVVNGFIMSFYRTGMRGGTFARIVADVVIFGAIWTVAITVACTVVSLLEVPAEVDSAATPTTLLRSARRTVITQMAIGGTVAGMMTGPVAPPIGKRAFLVLSAIAPDLTDDINLVWLGPFDLYTIVNLVFVTVIVGLGFGLVFSSWGQWVVFARLWLPLTGRLPWNLPVFLDDAYQRGVLRQSGPIYHFRHDLLRNHLADSQPPTGSGK